MRDVTFKPVPLAEKDIFTQYFQDYLAELARLNGAKPNRRGLYEYGLYDLYWLDDRFMPFFMECEERKAGQLLLRDLPESESPTRQRTIQVAEIFVFRPFRRRGLGRQAIRFAAEMAKERGLPVTWSAYMNNDPANALYQLILDEFNGKDGAWAAQRARGVDLSGFARFYYQMTPAAVSQEEGNL